MKPPTSVVCTETVGPEIADRFFPLGCGFTGSPEMEWVTAVWLFHPPEKLFFFLGVDPPTVLVWTHGVTQINH